jgi:hypothetical protein
MKITKGFIATVVIILYHSFCIAQQKRFTASQWVGIEKKCIESAAYIFEGTVTSQECYYAKNKAILTCSVMQITKIYKGNTQLKLGTIKVLTYQSGRVKNGGSIRVNDAGPGLGRGHYIFFGKLADSSWIVDNMVATDNSIILTIAGYPIVFLGNDGAQWGGTQYKTLDELYAFFKENGLKVEEQTVPADSTKQK